MNCIDINSDYTSGNLQDITVQAQPYGFLYGNSTYNMSLTSNTTQSMTGYNSYVFKGMTGSSSSGNIQLSNTSLKYNGPYLVQGNASVSQSFTGTIPYELQILDLDGNLLSTSRTTLSSGLLQNVTCQAVTSSPCPSGLKLASEVFGSNGTLSVNNHSLLAKKL
jgi:hypothetical protein